MVTGKWNDIGKFKGPVLRALAARPPYFHDGSAATLADVISFYDTRFQARFTEQEKADLLAFLRGTLMKPHILLFARADRAGRARRSRLRRKAMRSCRAR